MKENLILFILLIASTLSFAQSDKNKDQQEVYTLLYSKELDQAKKVITTKFLESENNSKKIIGYVDLADYLEKTVKLTT